MYFNSYNGFGRVCQGVSCNFSGVIYFIGNTYNERNKNEGETYGRKDFKES